MATHASAEKAARQAIKHAQRNNVARSQYKTAVKKIKVAMTAKYESKDAATKALAPLISQAQRVLMRAASKNVIKSRTASRQISRLNLAVQRVIG